MKILKLTKKAEFSETFGGWWLQNIHKKRDVSEYFEYKKETTLKRYCLAKKSDGSDLLYSHYISKDLEYALIRECLFDNTLSAPFMANSVTVAIKLCQHSMDLGKDRCKIVFDPVHKGEKITGVWNMGETRVLIISIDIGDDLHLAIQKIKRLDWYISLFIEHGWEVLSNRVITNERYLEIENSEDYSEVVFFRKKGVVARITWNFDKMGSWNNYDHDHWMYENSEVGHIFMFDALDTNISERFHLCESTFCAMINK